MFFTVLQSEYTVHFSPALAHVTSKRIGVAALLTVQNGESHCSNTVGTSKGTIRRTTEATEENDSLAGHPFGQKPPKRPPKRRYLHSVCNGSSQIPLRLWSLKRRSRVENNICLSLPCTRALKQTRAPVRVKGARRDTVCQSRYIRNCVGCCFVLSWDG